MEFGEDEYRLRIFDSDIQSFHSISGCYPHHHGKQQVWLQASETDLDSSIFQCRTENPRLK